VLNRLPLAIVLPLAAATMVAIIGISFGLLFLEVDERFSPDHTLAVALIFTALIMAGATLLHRRTNTEHYPADTTGVPEMGGKIDRPGQPWEKGPTDPTLEDHGSSRPSDGKRPH
jgi:hypothetical protein